MSASPRPVPIHSSWADAAPAAPAELHINPLIRITLYLYVFSIPFEMPQRTIPVEIPTLMGAVFLLTTVLQPSVCFRRLPAAFVWFLVYLWAFGIVIVLNEVPHTQLVIQLFIWALQVILLFWVGTNLLMSHRVLRGVLLSLIAACTLRATLQVLGIGAMEHDVYSGGGRVTMFGQNTNLTSMILAAGMAAAVGLQVSASRRFPRLGLFTWPVAGLMGLAIIQSGSRGGLLSAGLGVAVFALRGASVGQRVRNAILAILALVLLGWGAFQTDVMRNRIEDAAAQGHLAGREEIYPALVQMFRERPVFGWGPIENQFEIARRTEFVKHPREDAHNLLGELLTSGGIFIAIPFLVGMALCIRGAWQARHGPLGLTPAAILTAVLLGMVSGTWIVGKIVWLALAIALAAGKHWSEPPPHGPTTRHEMVGV